MSSLDDTNWDLGYATLGANAEPSTNTLPLYTLSNIQFTHQSADMFIDKLDTWSDILNYNNTYGNMRNTFLGVNF